MLAERDGRGDFGGRKWNSGHQVGRLRRLRRSRHERPRASVLSIGRAVGAWARRSARGGIAHAGAVIRAVGAWTLRVLRRTRVTAVHGGQKRKRGAPSQRGPNVVRIWIPMGDSQPHIKKILGVIFRRKIGTDNKKDGCDGSAVFSPFSATLNILALTV